MRRLNLVGRLVLLVLLASASRAEAQWQRCSGSADEAVLQCQLQPPKPDRHSCPDTSDLGTVLRQHGLVPGAGFKDIKAAALRLNTTEGLGFRVVFRPVSDLTKAGQLLDTNPHARSDVTVCRTHEVVLYVGRLPFQRMPGEPLAGMSVADALTALKAQPPGLEPVFVAGVIVDRPDLQRRVIAQYPAASSPLGKEVRMLAFEMPAQRPVLLLSSEPPKACPPPPPPDPSEEVPKGDDAAAWVAGVGGAAGGLTLARVLRSSGGGSPRPPAPGRPAAGLPATRVRRDVGEPREQAGPPALPESPAPTPPWQPREIDHVDARA